MALVQAGHKVIVLWCPLSQWADASDQKLFKELHTINWIKVGFHPEFQPICYWYARLRKKFWQLVYNLIGDYFDSAIKSLVLFSQELTSKAKYHKADLYVGHNLGALSAIVQSSKKYNVKSIFDFEDFHRGEFTKYSSQSKKVEQIESKYIPYVSSLTSASPAITIAYRHIFPNTSITTINNCFLLSYASDGLIQLPITPLKLFWFSQYVGKMRGLESVIEAMSNFSIDEITLTLLGTASTEVKNYFNVLSEKFSLKQGQLVFLDPVSEKEIFDIASIHHIGLASEYSHNMNRDLCLTNKIFTYMLAGNALVLSDTYAQKAFLSENPGIGLLYKQNSTEELTALLKSYLRDSHLLQLHRQKALNLAKTKYNWDIEQKQFLVNVKSVLT